jgi:ABC-type Fe3+ transport system permease subunit
MGLFRKRKKGGEKIRYITIPTYSSGMTSSRDIEKQLNEAIEKAQETSQRPHDPEKVMSESRKTIALTFVISFVVIVAVVVVGVPVYNAVVFHSARVVVEETTYQPLDMEKVLATLGTLLGTPLGFVVGYYFKEEHARLKAKAAAPRDPK